MIIGIAGLSHLGIITAVGLAEKGFKILAWDSDLDRSKNFRTGKTTISEPLLSELLYKNSTNITFAENCSELEIADLVYIAADTPTDNASPKNLIFIHKIISEVTKFSKKEAVIIILSQVPPGFTRRIKIPNKHLFYQVETLIFGRAIERFLKPERFIIGCADSNQPIHSALLTILETFNCPILPMSYESAELAKISINCMLTAQISTTNMLSSLCESIGASWSEITPALQSDKRIGKYAYLEPGLGLAGGNLERDLKVLNDLTAINQIENTQIAAWLKTSDYQKTWLFRNLKSIVLDHIRNPKIAVLGLAYKENTDSIKNSPAIHFLNQIKGHDIYVHDPVVKLNNILWAKQVQNPFEAIEGADVLILTTAWPEYKTISIRDINARMRGRIIIDPLAVLFNQNPERFDFKWLRLGSKTIDKKL